MPDSAISKFQKFRRVETLCYPASQMGLTPRAPLACYLAAPWPLRTEAQALLPRLRAVGWGCTSRWLTEDSSDLSDHWARLDLRDVQAADLLLAWNPPGWADRGTGGRHVEFGYALALGKPILLIGERTHLFHWLDAVVVRPTMEAGLIYLEQRQKARVA